LELGIENRVALVTGASKGIGAGIAAELVAEGARVAICSRSRERIESTAKQIDAEPFVWDTSDVDGAGDLVDRVEQRFGAPVDILALSTGGPPADPDALSFSREQWDDAYRNLVLSPMALISRLVPQMGERGWGRVVNVVSYAAREPIPAIMLSNTHRAGILGAFKTVSRQVAATGVTLNSILPGTIATDRVLQTGRSREEIDRSARETIPVGRLGTVEEIAAAAAFLCSERAGYITGVSLLVDGGATRAV
jgi:3-oxoacyl-[acyl-carrier protein] reductase